MVLVVGGETVTFAGNDLPSSASVTLLSSAELYDPTTNTWSAAGNMATARAQPAAVLLNNGTVLACGAGSTALYPGCELYG